ncbi:PREDICTED: uncharacterized protein LOC105950132 [Erythranthe guttata]|uniref:uncharacterized protein LOC105950132 n=1 Tax=Erythranthe guttata TaxID=4155 RepID=UPI00064DE636|nr:PREDICTED: uncharacterized protein LOC105950132 [Erythranthe guttata]|eukprot:XP_012828903.1 PREDICTED: uncharacterized protein LOC105950132 [Erythranthe guttata]
MYVSHRILLRFGCLIAIKRCSESLNLKELVEFVILKWKQLKKCNITLTYILADYGECILSDDDDMVSMFDMMKLLSLECIEVIVKENNRFLVGANPSCVDHVQLPVTQYNRSVVVNEMNVEGVVDTSVGKKLLSAEWVHLIKEVGQVFLGGVDEFRKCLIKFSVEMGFEFAYVKNESYRVTAECRFKHEAQCSWRIHASISKSNGSCYIRKYNKEHQCGMFFGTVSRRRMTSRVIIDLIEGDIRAMPGITPREVQKQVKEKFGVEISYFVAWKSTDAGRNRIFGDHNSSYAYLPSYFAEAERTNPGSIFNLDIDESKRIFRRCFFAFAACLVGFKSCRPVVMLDGTFLKGKHKGILLSAIGKDGDEGVRQIFPDALHGYCYKHLTRNLQHRFRGVAPNFRDAVLAQFANCAYAVTNEDFARCIQKLRATGGKKVCNFLDGIPKEKWANAHFEGLRYGQMTSNGCESWNSQVGDERYLPITSLIDGIRMLLMEQLSDRLGDGNRWTTVLTESVDKKMRQLVDKGRTWERKKSSETVYEVLSTPNAVVDLRERVCSCKLWQINGLPCAHAAVVIFLEIGGGYEYIDKWFHRSTFVQSYSGSVVPFVRLDNDIADSDIGPPEYHPSRGRPKRKRIPSNGEFTSRKMRCSHCKEVGNHNKKTCRK